MKNKTHIVYLVIITILICVLSFQPDKGKDFIIIPPIEGSFTKDSLVPIEKDSIKIDVQYRDSIIEVPSNTNIKLFNDYEKAQDTIEQLRLYIEAIQEREYEEEFSNEDIEITARMKATGWINSVDLDYKIKERKVPLPRNPYIFRAGPMVGVGERELQYKARFSIENREGIIYSTEIGKNEILVGVDFPIFKIK